MGIAGQLFSALSTLFSSSFDIGSDMVNSLDFLGYNASTNLAQTVSDTLSTIIEQGNSSIFDAAGADNTTDTSQKYEEHRIWGIVGISVIFLPGIIAVQPLFWVQINIKSYKMALLLFLAGLVYPLTLVFMAFTSILCTFKKEKFFLEMTIMLVGVEAFFESFPQMVLQGFTIIYGYEVTTVQLIAISGSFVLLARTCIVFDLQMLDKDLSFKQSMIHTIRILPTHVVTITFRVISFSLTLAFLREWSAIPILVLYIELVIITHILDIGRWRTKNHS